MRLQAYVHAAFIQHTHVHSCTYRRCSCLISALREETAEQRALVVSGRNCPAPGETPGNSISISPPSQSHQGQLPSTQWVYSASFPEKHMGQPALTAAGFLGAVVAPHPLEAKVQDQDQQLLLLQAPPLLTLQPCLFPVSSKGCPSVYLHPNPC